MKNILGCTVVDCGHPPHVENGKPPILSARGTVFNSVVKYECADGYNFRWGTKTSRSCLASGNWSDEDIHCGEREREGLE